MSAIFENKDAQAAEIGFALTNTERSTHSIMKVLTESIPGNSLVKMCTYGTTCWDEHIN